MKRSIVVLIFLLVFMLVFYGCSAPKSSNQQSTEKQPETQETQEKNKTEEKQEMEKADQKSETEEPQETKKDWLTVAVAFDGYNEAEYNGVIKAFEGSEYNIITVSTQKGDAKGMSEGSISIERTIEEITDPGLGIIVIGGAGSVELWKNENLIKIIKIADEQGNLIASICAAPGVLANADVVDGKKACWYNTPDLDAMMADAGATDTGEDVCIDDNLITGNGPPSADEFGAAVFDYNSKM